MDNLPLPPAELRHYEADDQFYIQSGKCDIGSLSKILQTCNRNLKDFRRILDFGCADGRATRHLPESAERWGIDCRPEPIQWLNNNFPPSFQFRHVNFRPPTLLPSGYFDLIFAHSVFTHLDAMFVPWIKECRRLLGTDGILVASFIDPQAARACSQYQWYTDLKTWYKRKELTTFDFDHVVMGDGASIERKTNNHSPYSSGLYAFHSENKFKELVHPHFLPLRTRRPYYFCQSGMVLSKL